MMFAYVHLIRRLAPEPSRSAHGGAAGASGLLGFSAGSASAGNSGALRLGSGASTAGRGGGVSVSVGSGTSGVRGIAGNSGLPRLSRRAR